MYEEYVESPLPDSHKSPSIISKLLFNEYVPIHSFYANTPYENVSNPQIEYNPELAAKLLAEAGYTTKNNDGLLL